MKKKFIIPIAVVLLLALVAVLIVIFSNNDSDTPPESLSIPISEPTSETMSEPISEQETVLTSEATSEEPIVSEPPELISIDNTPADVYVDIEAGGGNPANNLPWLEAGEGSWGDGTVYIEIDLANNGISGFTWNEILQVEPHSMQIGTEVPPELLDLPRRIIQNRDAARVVANEIVRLLELDMRDYLSQILREVNHDPEKNIWIFGFGFADPFTLGSWSAYAVNGYNGQVIRGWIT